MNTVSRYCVDTVLSVFGADRSRKTTPATTRNGVNAQRGAIEQARPELASPLATLISWPGTPYGRCCVRIDMQLKYLSLNDSLYQYARAQRTGYGDAVLAALSDHNQTLGEDAKCQVSEEQGTF